MITLLVLLVAAFAAGAALSWRRQASQSGLGFADRVLRRIQARPLRSLTPRWLHPLWPFRAIARVRPGQHGGDANLVLALVLAAVILYVWGFQVVCWTLVLTIWLIGRIVAGVWNWLLLPVIDDARKRRPPAAVVQPALLPVAAPPVQVVQYQQPAQPAHVQPVLALPSAPAPAPPQPAVPVELVDGDLFVSADGSVSHVRTVDDRSKIVTQVMRGYH